jgi:hypothetical protein
MQPLTFHEVESFPVLRNALIQPMASGGSAKAGVPPDVFVDQAEM